MKDSAKYFTIRIREERIRDYASVTRIFGYKIGHADHNRPVCSKSNCIFTKSRNLLCSKVQQKQHFRPSSSIELTLPGFSAGFPFFLYSPEYRGTAEIDTDQGLNLEC